MVSTNLLIPDRVGRPFQFELIALPRDVAFLKGECALLCKVRNGLRVERCERSTKGDSRRP